MPIGLLAGGMPFLIHLRQVRAGTPAPKAPVFRLL